MEEITVRGKRVKVDIEGELRQFDWGNKVRWTEDKLTAPSPFRYDKSPSFFVNLTSATISGKQIQAGTWKDSGYEYEEWASGNFTKLLAFMRNESYEETEDYLASTYGIELEYDGVTLEVPKLMAPSQRNALPDDFLKPYKYRHAYLGNRGITEKVQRMMRIGYDPNSNAVVIPWINQKGKIVNCKFRTVTGKIFWYTKNALPIKHNLYGIDFIYATGAKRAVICEAEIDALTWLSWGIPAIALGGATFTSVQADIIKRSPIEQLIIGADNDDQGRMLRNHIINKMECYVNLHEVIYPDGYKDANEIRQARLQIPTFAPITHTFNINW